MRNLLLIVCYILLWYSYEVQAQTTLQPGDVAIIGYNFKDPDQFSFIFLHEADEGTILYITDCGYDAISGAFRPGEGLITYTVPAGGLKTGEIITYPDNGNFITQGVSGFFGLSANGDQLLIFQGTFTNPFFIYALTVYDETWQTASTTNNNTSLPAGLINGISAVAQSRIINGKMNCSGLTLDKGYFLKGLAEESNWERNQDNRYELPNENCRFIALGFEKNIPVVEDVFQMLLAPPGYDFIDVYTVDGSYILRASDMEDIFKRMNTGMLYIFKIYYPDRLEIRKVITSK